MLARATRMAELFESGERVSRSQMLVKGHPGRRRFGTSQRQMTATFIDSAMADAFRNYHLDQAMLRILSRTAYHQSASQARRPRVARLVRVGL